MDIKDCDAGTRVIYTPPGGGKDQEEHGVVNGRSATTVFVLYDGDTHAKGTRPQDLRLERKLITPVAGLSDKTHGIEVPVALGQVATALCGSRVVVRATWFPEAWAKFMASPWKTHDTGLCKRCARAYERSQS